MSYFQNIFAMAPFQSHHQPFKVPYSYQLSLCEHAQWQEIPSYAYNGSADVSEWPLFFIPIVWAIKESELVKASPNEIAVIITAYVYDSDFQCERDVVNWKIKMMFQYSYKLEN